MQKRWLLGLMVLVMGEVYAMKPTVVVRNVDLYERVYVDCGVKSVNSVESHVPCGGQLCVQFLVEKSFFYAVDRIVFVFEILQEVFSCKLFFAYPHNDFGCCHC